MTIKRSIWIGVDQTGATRDQGKTALPLPLAWVRLEKTAERQRPPRLEIHTLQTAQTPAARRRLLTLPALTSESLHETVQTDSRLLGPETVLLLDCVLGLPEELRPTNFDLWTLLERAASFPGGYGRAPAEAFFEKILTELAPGRKTPPFPSRQIERALQANSVFQSRPYQKNIQTGTYRMWRELGRSPRWLKLWPFDGSLAHDRPESEGKPIALEGYPSYLWRTLLGEPKRAPDRCMEVIERALQAEGVEPLWSGGSPGAPVPTETLRSLLTRSPDHADALVLAVGAFLLDRANRLFPEQLPQSARQCEGWIAGAPIQPLLQKTAEKGARSQ